MSLILLLHIINQTRYGYLNTLVKQDIYIHFSVLEFPSLQLMITLYDGTYDDQKEFRTFHF